MNTSPIPMTVIGAPLDLGAENLGVAIGPEAFRYQDFIPKLTGAGFAIEDLGNIKVKERAEATLGNPRLKFMDEIVHVNEELAAKTEMAVKAGRKVVVLGGDHSVDLGAFSGAASACDGKLGMIYIDAHGDMNTDNTTQSGNIHGMHLASLLGFGAPELAQLHYPETKLARENLLHIAGCDWDQAELDLIEREGLKSYSMFDILTKSLGPLIAHINNLAAQVPNVWVSLDLDAIDRIYAPGAGMPNAKGLSYREIATIAQYIGEHCNVVGIDVVEYNPLQDEDRKTAELATELTAKFFGRDYSWYSAYMDKNAL